MSTCFPKEILPLLPSIITLFGWFVVYRVGLFFARRSEARVKLNEAIKSLHDLRNEVRNIWLHSEFNELEAELIVGGYCNRIELLIRTINPCTEITKDLSMIRIFATASLERDLGNEKLKRSRMHVNSFSVKCTSFILKLEDSFRNKHNRHFLKIVFRENK